MLLQWIPWRYVYYLRYISAAIYQRRIVAFFFWYAWYPLRLQTKPWQVHCAHLASLRELSCGRSPALMYRILKKFHADHTPSKRLLRQYLYFYTSKDDVPHLEEVTR